MYVIFAIQKHRRVLQKASALHNKQNIPLYENDLVSFASCQAQHFRYAQFEEAKKNILQTLRSWQLNILLSLLHQLKKIKIRFGSVRINRNLKWSSNAETSTHNWIFFLGNSIVSMLITIQVLLNPVRLDMKNHNKYEIYAFELWKWHMLENIQVITEKASRYRREKGNKNTCFPHLMWSSFWQGVPMLTASHDHKNQSGLNPHRYLIDMIVCDPAHIINRKQYGVFRK